MKILASINLRDADPTPVDRRTGFDSAVEALIALGVVNLALKDLAAWNSYGDLRYPRQFFNTDTDPELYRSVEDEVAARRFAARGGNFRGVEPFLSVIDSQKLRACMAWGAATANTIHVKEPNVVRGGAMLLEASMDQADQVLDQLRRQHIKELADGPDAELPIGICEYKRTGDHLFVVASGFYSAENDGYRLTMGGYAEPA